MVQDLTTYILVSGLLTTTTYPALYSQYFLFTDSSSASALTSGVPQPETPDASAGCPPAVGQSISIDTSLSSWFRAMNGVSFAFSVGAIFIAVLTMATLQYSSETGPESRLWPAGRVKAAYFTIWVLLLLSLASALTGAGIAACTFDTFAAGWLAFGCLIIAVTTVYYGIMMTAQLAWYGNIVSLILAHLEKRQAQGRDMEPLQQGAQ